MPIISTNSRRHQAPEQSVFDRTYRSRRGSREAASRMGCDARFLRLGAVLAAFASMAPVEGPAAEAGDAIESMLTVATAAASGNNERKKQAIGEASRFA